MRYKESKTFLSEEQKKFLEWICSKQSNITMDRDWETQVLS